MDITFDPAKNARNIERRGLNVERVKDFDFQTALNWIDARKADPEVRFTALGWLGGRVHSVVFTETERGLRVISLRKANRREVNRYEQETQS